MGKPSFTKLPKNLRDISLVVSWLGTRVARMKILSAYEPMIGWKGEHPQFIGWLEFVKMSNSFTLCN